MDMNLCAKQVIITKDANIISSASTTTNSATINNNVNIWI